MAAQNENLGFYPPAFFFYQFLLFAVFHAVRLVACCRNAESGADPVRHVSYESETTPGKQNQALAGPITPNPDVSGKLRTNIHHPFNQTLHPTICDCQLVKLDVAVLAF